MSGKRQIDGFKGDPSDLSLGLSWLRDFCGNWVILICMYKINCAFNCPVLRSKVEPVFRDHCHERPPGLKYHTFLAEGPTFQYNWTCHQRPPVLSGPILWPMGWSFKTGSTVPAILRLQYKYWHMLVNTGAQVQLVYWQECRMMYLQSTHVLSWAYRSTLGGTGILTGVQMYSSTGRCSMPVWREQYRCIRKFLTFNHVNFRR